MHEPVGAGVGLLGFRVGLGVGAGVGGVGAGVCPENCSTLFLHGGE